MEKHKLIMVLLIKAVYLIVEWEASLFSANFYYKFEQDL